MGVLTTRWVGCMKVRGKWSEKVYVHNRYCCTRVSSFLMCPMTRKYFNNLSIVSVLFSSIFLRYRVVRFLMMNKRACLARPMDLARHLHQLSLSNSKFWTQSRIFVCRPAVGTPAASLRPSKWRIQCPAWWRWLTLTSLPVSPELPAAIPFLLSNITHSKTCTRLLVRIRHCVILRNSFWRCSGC